MDEPEIKEESSEVEDPRITELREKSELEWTAKDHKLFGSTPPENMARNPDKRMVDLMTDEEIKDYLAKQKERLTNNLENELYDSDFGKNAGPDYLRNVLKQSRLARVFLEKIGRLPKDL